MRWVPVATLAGAVVGLAYIATTAMDDGLTYYATPTEVSRQVSVAGQGSGVEAGTVRLGGMVLPGSLERSSEDSRLLLTDGVTDVPVRYAGYVPAAVQEGEGAVVEGAFDEAGTFRATEIVLRHSNEYQAAP